MRFNTPVTLLLATLLSLTAASPAPLPAPAPPPAPNRALAPRNQVIGPSLSPAQQRKLASLKSQYNSLKARTKALASQSSSISSAQAAARRSLSSVSRIGASLEAVTLLPTPSPVPAPASGCAKKGQVIAPGPNGGQDGICVPLCFPEALSNGKPTFGRTTIQRPGSNANCRALCASQQQSQNPDLAYYAVGQPFSYTSGFFRARVYEGAACHCVTVAELKARVKSGLAGKGKGCTGKLGGSGGEDSLAVYAVDPAVVG